MIKLFMMLVLVVAGTSAFAGECCNSNCCAKRSRVVNVTREVVNVPVTITRRTIQATRPAPIVIGLGTRIRNIVR